MAVQHPESSAVAFEVVPAPSRSAGLGDGGPGGNLRVAPLQVGPASPPQCFGMLTTKPMCFSNHCKLLSVRGQSGSQSFFADPGVATGKTVEAFEAGHR